MKFIKQLLNEMYGPDLDDEEGLTRVEKDLYSKAERDLKAKGIRVRDFDPDEIMGKTRTQLDRDIEDKPSTLLTKGLPKDDESSSDDKESSDKHKSMKTERGTKSQKAHDWLNQHPNATRKEFIQHATDHLGFTKAYANIAYYNLKKKVMEFYVITHPSKDAVVLREYHNFSTKWTNFEDVDAPDAMIFESKHLAMKALNTIGAGKIIKYKA